MKVVLLGAYAVGKSTLISRFCNVTERIEHTVGIALKTTTRTLEDRVVHLKFFDTSGYPHYEPLLDPYIYNADVILIVYSITSMESFHKAMHWLHKITQVNTATNVVLIANKIDLLSERRVHINDARKRVKTFNTDLFILECSAHSGEGVKDALDVLIREGSRQPDTLDLIYTAESFRRVQPGRKCNIL